MEDIVASTKIKRRRLSYRIGDNLPRPLRFIYYAILILSGIYILYRIIEWILKTIQKIGQFIFDDRTYWAVWICILILVIGGLLLGQYYFDLDPFGKIAEFFMNFWNQVRETIYNWLEEFSSSIYPY